MMIMKKNALISFALLLLFTSFTGDLQQDDINAKSKAVYLYNFTKYIEWPPANKEGNFVIAIVGNNPGLLAELNKMASSKTADKQKFEIKPVSTPSEAGKCNILYVTGESKVNLAEVSQKVKANSTLLVSEKTGALNQGSIINFVVIKSKLAFEINKSHSEKFNLKVSSSLLSLAIDVK